MPEMIADSQWAGVAIGALALVLSVISTVASVWIFSRQHSLAYQAFLSSKTQEITGWAAKVLAVMARMQQRLEDREKSLVQRVQQGDPELLAELSSLIDFGRWYFPNYDHDRIGTDRSFAYRGKRQYVLDLCVEVHRLFRDAARDVGPGTAAKIEHFRREFVSEIQIAVNPRRLRSRDLQRMRVLTGSPLKMVDQAGAIKES